MIVDMESVDNSKFDPGGEDAENSVFVALEYFE